MREGLYAPVAGIVDGGRYEVINETTGLRHGTFDRLDAAGGVIPR